MKKILSIGILLAVLAVSGCSLFRDEKQAYIDAMVEAACVTFSASDLTAEKVVSDIEEIFIKHGFDPKDEAKMTEIAEKYLEDEEVKSAVLKGAVECGIDVPGLNKIQPETPEVPEELPTDDVETPIEIEVPLAQ